MTFIDLFINFWILRDAVRLYILLVARIFPRPVHPQLVKYWPVLRAKPSNKIYVENKSRSRYGVTESKGRLTHDS